MWERGRPTSREALLDLVMITSREELVKDVKVEGNLGDRDHNMMEFRIFRAGRKDGRRIRILDFIKTNFNQTQRTGGQDPLGDKSEGKRKYNQLSGTQESRIKHSQERNPVATEEWEVQKEIGLDRPQSLKLVEIYRSTEILQKVVILVGKYIRVSQGCAERKLGRPKHYLRCNWKGTQEAIKRDSTSS